MNNQLRKLKPVLSETEVPTTPQFDRVCSICKGEKGAYDKKRVWRRCQYCKGTGMKKGL